MLNSVLIVDDDPAESQHLCEILEPLGHKPVPVDSGSQALDRLDGPFPFSAVILDLVMPDMDGMTVLQRLAARPASAPPVIVQVTENGIDAAGSALRAGAVDFLVKPATAERVRAALTNAMRISRLERELIRIGRRRAGTTTLRDLAAGSPVMERAISLAERASRSNIPVLVEGEPGVGKEQLARAIHNASPRRARQFIVADCTSGNAGVAPVRSVSELLEQARGGTLYLDNAGRLSEGDQEALLRHMDQTADRAVNTGRPDRNGVRIIAASDYRLIDLVSAGQFREDLFYRLNVLPIWLPPLRERCADMPELANRCLTWFAAEQGKAQIYEIAPDAMQHLMGHSWPGNDQELENTLYRAVALASGPVLERPTLIQLGIEPQQSAQSGGDPAAAGTDHATETRRCNTTIGKANNMPLPPLRVQPVQKGTGEKPALVASARSPETGRRQVYGSRQLLNDYGEICKLESLEAEAIRFAIHHYQGRMSEVARRLGIGRSTLYRKLREYDLEPERPTAA